MRSWQKWARIVPLWWNAERSRLESQHPLRDLAGSARAYLPELAAPPFK